MAYLDNTSVSEVERAPKTGSIASVSEAMIDVLMTETEAIKPPL
jgi:hypothetical protein